MYCSHCGKKVTDTMLFCPFCGDPIVIPEQDAPEDAPQASYPAPDAAPQPDKADETPQPEEIVERPAEPAFVPLDLDSEAPADKAEGDALDAAAELLDWSASRRDFADDVWARRDAQESGFEPLDLDGGDDGTPEDWREEIVRRKEAAAGEKHAPKIERDSGEPVRLDGVAPKLEAGRERAKAEGRNSEAKPRKHANTLLPPKAMDPDDIFMDGGTSEDDYDAYDQYDKYEKYAAPRFEDEKYAYEEEEEGGFFMRHLRGLVGLALFVILILMFVIYALSFSGQLTLAKINLAWSAGAYSQLGDQSYEDGRYAQAGQYYERALQREGDSYSYASAAAMAYLEAKDTEKAAAMLKRCVQIDPDQLEPYIYLLNLYPEASERPWDVTPLLQQGYQRTGDDRLKVTG